MPRFEPFRGLRYNTDQVRLRDVIAPPYDVIGPAERARLAAREPANAVHVELPVEDASTGRDRYEVAAALLREWRDKELLLTDPSDSFFLYRMTTPEGRSSTGVIGALGLPGQGDDGDVLPHEQTTPKAKTDRLELLRATRTNLSPIWGLSLTTGLTALLEPEGPPTSGAVDDEGVRHQLWVLDDQARLEGIRTAVTSTPVVLADGHHRYETALAYRTELRSGGGGSPSDELVMALVVELADEQLEVDAIHRTFAGLREPEAAFARWFELEPAGPPTAEVVRDLAGRRCLSLVTREGTWLLTPREETLDAAGGELDTDLVTVVSAALAGVAVAHRHGWQEAYDAVVGGEAEAALLLRPVNADRIRQYADARRLMPPKTTYFRPKPRTGMVFRPLEP